MTEHQLDVLLRLVQDADPTMYTIIGIEYPSHPPNWRAGDGTCMKIQTKQHDRMRKTNYRYVDYYDEQGRTVDTQEYVA